jgi:hypothetical protein
MPLLVGLLTCSGSAADVPDFKVNDDFGATYQGYSNIATDLSGNFVVCWYDKRNGNNDIYIQLFDRDGNRQGTNRRVNDDVASQDQLRPSMIKDQSGKFVVVWQDFRNNGYPFNGDIYGQRFLTDGTPQSANFKTNDDYGTETQGWQDIDADDLGNFVVVWEDNRNSNYDIYAQRYHKSGTKLGSNFRVNDDNGVAYQHSPKITMDGDGDFVVVWYDSRTGQDNILGQRFNASGVAQGGNFQVNDIIAAEKHVFPDVACDYNGNFTVVWIDYRNGNYPTNPDVYGRMYWANGTSRSGNFRVNADGSSASQAEVVIGMDYFGNYITAWRDDREGNNDIYAQYYGNTGTAIGLNYRVNTDATTATQSFPNVTMDGINIYYTWTDDRSGSFDVWAKITEYGKPTMVITPVSFQFDSQLGGGNPPTQNLLIVNTGYGILNWQGTSNQSWLQINPVTGTAPSNATISVNTAGLAYGSYAGRITIADVSGKDSSRTAVVALDITAPLLQITPQSVAIEAHLGAPPPDDKFVTISNSGAGTLNWSLSGAPNWLRFSRTAGSAPAAVDLLILIDSLPGPGQYNATIIVTSSEAVNSPQQFSVQLSYLADSPIISTDPDTIALTFAVNATSVTPAELVIQNIGVGALNWSIAADATWVVLSTDNGVGDGVITVGAVPSVLTVGRHYSQLTISDPAAYNSPFKAVVQATVTDVPPIIAVTPDSLSFVCYLGGPQDSARSVSISNSGGGSMPWSITDNAVWLDFTPASGNGNAVVKANVSTGGLPVSAYSAWAFFNAPASTNLKDSLFVRMQIASWLPQICGLPTGLEFMARANVVCTDTQIVTVQNCAAPGMTWAISASPSWLSATPQSGTEAQSSRIIMNTSGLPAGDYNGLVTVSSAQASNSPVTIGTHLKVVPIDSVALTSANVRQGQPFSIDLRLHNLLPVDSLYLLLQFDNDLLQFDSVSNGARLGGVMSLELGGKEAQDVHQVAFYSKRSGSQLPAANGVIASFHFRCQPTAPENEYPIICSAHLRDSLGVNLTLPSTTGRVNVTTGTPVEPVSDPGLPRGFQLYQNFPNPFNGATSIYYSLDRPDFVRIEALNILGQSVKSLFSGYQSAGSYFTSWDGRDDQLRELGSGIYFIRLISSQKSDIVRAVLLK